eukprot:TRINITY_DN46396_c0_g1_i1.p2 TRINITY_DN46396_c0_g1~~TRINITY_DN46396_c0_g1_i1.p2  ORF type:complete len:108 (-),score=2.32 TRINITY_DN46396_c0_g1_i1:171-494(-)
MSNALGTRERMNWDSGISQQFRCRAALDSSSKSSLYNACLFLVLVLVGALGSVQLLDRLPCRPHIVTKLGCQDFGHRVTPCLRIGGQQDGGGTRDRSEVSDEANTLS